MSPDVAHALLERGRDAWPEVDLGAHAPAFIDHVFALVGSEPAALDDLRVEELYLCFACARGLEPAIRRLETEFRSTLEKVYASRRPAGVEMDEFVQSVRVRLLVGDPPKILSFEGRGPLRAWMKMVAARRLADLGQATRSAGDRMLSDDLLLTRLMPTRDLSTRIIQQRHRPDVQRAVERALRRLEPAQRVLLRERFLFGLTLADLARLHGVHRVTVSKRLARARRAILDGLRDELRGRFETDAEVESIARLCLSQLEMSLEPLLASQTSVER